MSKVCETNTISDLARRDVSPGQFGGRTTLSSTTKGTGRGLSTGLLAIAASLGLLAGHAVSLEVVDTRDGHLAVSLSNDRQPVSRCDAQLVRGRMKLLGVGLTPEPGAKHAPDPETSIDIYRPGHSTNRPLCVRPSQRVEPDQVLFLPGPVAARSVGRARLGPPQPYMHVGREPLGSTPVGLSRPSEQHIAGYEMDTPRSPGEHHQSSALSIAEGIRIVLPSLTITDRSSPMSLATVDIDGTPSPTPVIKSPVEVVEAIITLVIGRLEQGLSQTKVRQEMASMLNDHGQLSHLDYRGQALARLVMELALVMSQMETIVENGRRQARAAEVLASSAFDKASKTANPSRRRQHLDVLGASLGRSKVACAIADQASDTARKLGDLIAPEGRRRVSFPLWPSWKAPLAYAPLTDSIPFGLAYAKGQLATWRASDPELMRSLTVRRDRAAKSARTPESKAEGRPEGILIAPSPAISVAVRGRDPRPDAIQDLAPLATVSDPQRDCDDPHPEDDPECGETDCPRPGDPDAQQMAFIDNGSTSNEDGDDPTEVTFPTDEP